VPNDPTSRAADAGTDSARAPDKPHKPRRRKASESTIEILERLLLRPRSMTLNREKTLMPTIQVILMHLLQKDMAGSRRARNVLLKYREFANRGADRKLDVRFADNSYAPVTTLKPEGKA
jgi:hypothetical protein